MSPLFSTRFNIIRTSLYIFLLFCALVVLGLDAHQISGVQLVGGILAYIIFLTVWTFVLVVPFVFILPLVRPGLALTQLKFELGVIAMLWILWLAAAADATNKFQYVLSFCGSGYLDIYGDFYGGFDCSEPRALLAFSWLAWLTLTALLGLTATLAFLEHGKGHPDVWHTPITDYPFGTTTANTSTNTPVTEANKEQVTNGEQVVAAAPVQQQQHQQV